MATDVDLQRLVVQLEASFTKYERSWNKALGVTDANVKRVQARYDGMTRSINNAGANAARALEPVGLQTANIASQFQDIVVQLQGGASPFTVALQQGTQLTQALGSNTGLKGALAGVAAGFGSLLNPVSLATIGIIALGGVAVQYFSTLISDGKVSAEELKKQEDLIRRVADRWGEAVPSLKAYVDQLDRLQDANDLNQATEIAIDQVYRQIVSSLSDLRAELSGARTDMQGAGADAQEIDRLQLAFDQMAQRAKDGTATGADLKSVIDLIAKSSVQATPMMQAIVQTLTSAQTQFDLAAESARKFDEERRRALQQGPSKELFTANRDFVAEQLRLNSLTAEQLALETEIGRVKADAGRDKVIISEQQALDLAKQRLAAEEERRSQVKSETKSGSKASDEAQREAEAVLQLIGQLEFEYDQLGLTAQQQAVANTLRRAGSAATDEQRARISELVDATYEEQQSIQAMQELYDQLGQAGKSAILGIVDAMKDGKIEAGELSSILSNLLGQFGNFFLNAAFSGGGSGAGTIFGSIFGGKRANGGPMSPGQAYLVGERGPEIVVPERSGYVIPNLQSRKMASGGGGMSLSVPITIQGNADSLTVQQLDHWARFKLPRIINHHAKTTLPEIG